MSQQAGEDSALISFTGKTALGVRPRSKQNLAFFEHLGLASSQAGSGSIDLDCSHDVTASGRPRKVHFS